uniref:MBD domain-containing protein n=1 Tax=Glossina brevipalpis TaxID=37001 RepID=A0A1A9WDE4_9MUSC
MNSNITIERKRVDCNALPKGWQREEVLRKSGISAGKVDVYYYSPTGKRIDTKPQLSRHLGDAIDISSFDFQKGKFIHHLPLPSISVYRCSAASGIGCVNSNTATSSIGSPLTITPQTAASNSLKRKHKTATQSTAGASPQHSTLLGSCGVTVPTTAASSNVNIRQQQQQLEFSRALRSDASLVPPIRQTASIFKQPVTVVRNHENNKVKHDTKHGAQEKPKQLFWEKRLERMRACHASGEELDDIVLPKNLKALGPNVHEQTVMQSLATALHVLNTPVTGQTATKSEFQKNAPAFINPDQPLMQAILVSDDDIRRQEDRVNIARRKLQEALKV